MLDPSLPAQLLHLLQTGFVADSNGALAPLLQNVAHRATVGWVASAGLLAQRETLSTDQELAAAILALSPEARQAWLAIIAARCKQAGQMGDMLPQLVTQLQGAAAWVAAALDHAALQPSAYAAIEHALLGVSAEQAPATPMLTRILAASFALARARQQGLPPLTTIDQSGLCVAQNWCAGRLLAMPGAAVAADYVLQGAGENQAQDDIGTGSASMAWVLANPWVFLLAMLAYAQDAWAAEARGSLLLELPNSQDPYKASQIGVLVQGADGGETRCGSLAGLLLRALAHLGMRCFPSQPSAETLDGVLGAIVGQLLQRHVWRYRDAASGDHGQYQIHPDFADACYRIAGSKVFKRSGKHVWQALRLSAEQWRSDLLPAPITRANQ